MIITLTDETFQKEVVESDKPVLIDFWAPWCASCKLLNPIMEKVSEAVGNSARICKVDVDMCPEITKQFNIVSVPTVLILRKGLVEDVIMGVKMQQVYINSLASSI